MTNCNTTNVEEVRAKAAQFADNLTKVAANESLPLEVRDRALNDLSGDVDRAADEVRKAEREAAETRALMVEEGWRGGHGPALLRDAGVDTNGMNVAEQQATLEELRQRGDIPTELRRNEGASWRHLFPDANEYRALIAEATPNQGGYSVPQKVANKWVEMLRARSTFLSAPGLNVVPFDSATFRIPAQLTSGAPSVVAEGATIPKSDMTFGALDFAAIKYGSIKQASSEILEDSSLPLEALIGQAMIEDMAAQIDSDAFVGSGSTAGLAGIASTAGNFTNTALATGKTSVSFDDVLDAYIAIVATGGTPTVIWCSMDQYKSLLKSRENTGGAGTGGYLAGAVSADPTGKAWGLPILPSPKLPVRTVVVADASRIYVGVRRQVIVHRSDEYGFGEDLSSWRATSRWAGIRVAEATSVQKVVASAS